MRNYNILLTIPVTLSGDHFLFLKHKKYLTYSLQDDLENVVELYLAEIER